MVRMMGTPSRKLLLLLVQLQLQQPAAAGLVLQGRVLGPGRWQCHAPAVQRQWMGHLTLL
jgi:hypothetical protein